jgi:hypothetical protein
MLCYFRKLKSDVKYRFVKYRLFMAYCMNMYGCELWLLSNDYLNDLCASWRKSLRRIWGLPLNSHNYLLPLISRCLPLADEICSRSLNFINATTPDWFATSHITAFSIAGIIRWSAIMHCFLREDITLVFKMWAMEMSMLDAAFIIMLMD